MVYGDKNVDLSHKQELLNRVNKKSSGIGLKQAISNILLVIGIIFFLHVAPSLEMYFSDNIVAIIKILVCLLLCIGFLEQRTKEPK